MQEELASLLPDDQPNSERCGSSDRCPWLLDFWATRYPGAKCPLFFTQAETALAQALTRGIEPIQFIKDWEANTRHLIRFHRRHRQRALLLSAEKQPTRSHMRWSRSPEIGLTLNVFDGIGKPGMCGKACETERFLAQRLMAADSSMGGSGN